MSIRSFGGEGVGGTFEFFNGFPSDLAWVGIVTQLGRISTVWWDQGTVLEDMHALFRASILFRLIF